MLKSKNFLLLILLVSLNSCKDSHKDHPVFKYYPSETTFKSGYVSKYYNHHYPKDPNGTARIRISYTLYQKIDDNRFMARRYNAGFELNRVSHYRIEDNTIYLDSAKSIWNADTIETEIINPNLSVWSEDMESPYRIRYESNDDFYIYTEQQVEFYDSLILDRSAKVFTNKSYYQRDGEDSIFREGESKSYYVEGLGFFGEHYYEEDFRVETELIEQMPVSKFSLLADHDLKRIAYIDPQNTLSDDSEFKLCRDEQSINDYYNARPNSGYIDGKGEMVRLIMERLESSKLEGQSGMLTFRFVVNCQGRAGRFVVEQIDFDYNGIQFSEECVNHLLEVLESLAKWQPLVINDEPRDAYTYITFKIKNGEIVDMLP